MRILLAGATGEIGRELLPRLVSAGHHVTAITRIAGSVEIPRAAGNAGGTQSGTEPRVVELVADLRDRAAFLDAVAGLHFDAVINQLSALAKPPTTYRRMRETNRLRWEGTSTLVAAAKATGATRFVSASVVYGYGFRNHGNATLAEATPFGLLPGSRLDNIQKALLSCEQQTHAIGGVVLRYGLFYRPRGRIPVVASDWGGVIPFVHVEDAADATVLALEKAPARSTYNIVDDEAVSWRVMHTARAEALSLPEPRELPTWYIRFMLPLAGKLIAQTSMRVSNSLARTELGWEPRYPNYRVALDEATEVAAHARAVAAGRAEVIRV
jgi:nucleoside-diphosphate-sugar epimerase